MSKTTDLNNRIKAGNNPVNEFRRVFEGAMRSEVAKQLPKGVDPDRFIRTAITTVQMQPDLLQADRSSLFAACMQAAKDGLLPDGREATIQVYNTKRGNEWVMIAQYMPMVGGLIKKMYASGCTKVDGVAVYEKDEFNYELGDEPKITHKPYWGAEDRGMVVAAYAIIKLENGEVKREVMGRSDIDKVREASKASKGPGWSNWYDQFAIKAVLKRAYKQVPGRSDEFESVANADNEAMGITFDHAPQAAEPVAAAIAPSESSSERLAAKIDAKVQETEIVAEQDTPAPAPVYREPWPDHVTKDGEIMNETENPAPQVEEEAVPALEDIPGLKKAVELTESQKEWVRGNEKDDGKE